MAGFEEITLRLADGYQAYGRLWAPAYRATGAVLYHHGIQSHCGWFEASAARLCSAGYAVLQVDRRGCGRNEEDRGDAESAEQLIADAGAARDELERRSGLDRYHVVGVSWGGRLAVAAYVMEPRGVASLSLVTPGLFPLVGVSKSEAAEIGFAMLYEPRRRFDIPLNAAELFTKVPQWRHFFETDPHTLRQCAASFFLASRRMDKIVARLGGTEPVPIHLLLAGDEHIIDGPRTSRFVHDLGWPQHRVTTYAGMRHGLEFEPDRETYFADLVDFLDAVAS
jgi:alpha-beta hydrolase superfamily lysophospholipase